jgi:hypothetical protein
MKDRMRSLIMQLVQTPHLGGGTAYELVFFQVAPGALHIDVLMGRKLGAHPIICSGTGFDVFAKLGFESLLQVYAL